MKNILLIFLLLVTASELMMANNIGEGLYNRLASQIEKNNKLDKEDRVYTMHVNSFGEDVSDMGLEWLEENHDGLIPFKDKYIEALVHYNDKPSGRIGGSKPQHYIMVIELNLVRLAQEDLVTANERMVSDHFVPNHPSSGVVITYEEEIALKLNNEIKEFLRVLDKDKMNVFDGNQELLVSILAVQRDISDAKHSSLQFQYFSNYLTAGSDFKSIIDNEYKPSVNEVVINDFSFINTIIDQFVLIFHDITPEIVTCTDIYSLGLVSDVSTQFYEFFCSSPDYDLDNSNFNDAVYNAARFLDYIHVSYTNHFDDNAISYFGANFISDWDSDLRIVMEHYYQSGMDLTFNFWLYDNFRNEFGDELSTYQAEFISLFFDPFTAVSGQDFVRILEDDFARYNSEGIFLIPLFPVPGVQEYAIIEYLKSKERLFIYLVRAVEYAYASTSLFTDEDRTALYNLIKNNTKALWDFYLNPAAPGVPIFQGIKVTQAAEKIGLFISQYEAYTQTIHEVEDIPDDLKIIVTGFKSSYVTSTMVETKEEVLELLQDISVKKTNDNASHIDFEIIVADNYVRKFNHNCKDCFYPTYTWQPVISDESKYKYNHVGESGAPEFFEIIGNLNIESPSYYDNCGDNCKSKLNFEYAFVTATRVRDEQLDEKIDWTLFTLEVVATAITFGEYAAASGFLRLLHGLILSADLSVVVISTFGIESNGSPNFEQGCENIFGTRGTEIAETVNLVMGIIAVGQILQGTLFKRAFSADELAATAAHSDYMKRVDDLFGEAGNNIDDLAYNDLKSIPGQIDNTFGVNAVPGGSQILRDAQHHLYGLNSISELSDELKNSEKLKDLLVAYQYSKKNMSLTDQISDGVLQTEDFLSGLSATEQGRLLNVLNGANGDELIAIFKNADAVRNSENLAEFKRLCKTSICN